MSIVSTNNQHYSDIADAIRAKKDTADTYTPSEMAAAIRSIPTGGGGGETPEAPAGEVNFYDFDGKRVYSYTLADAQALTALPAGPTHDGLTFGGWNWTLADIQAYSGPAIQNGLNIGANYSTTDGKTHILVNLDSPAGLTRYICLAVNGSVTIDWGDNSTQSVLAGTSIQNGSAVVTSHKYAAPGVYDITIEQNTPVTSYTFAAWTSLGVSRLISTKSYEWQARSAYAPLACVKEVHLGAGFVFGAYALAACENLAKISIPASISALDEHVFHSCTALKCAAVPRGVISVPDHCFNGASCCLACVPKTVTAIGESAFSGSQRSEYENVQNHISSIGPYAFYNDYSLQTLNIPASVTSIGSNAYTGDYGISVILCYGDTPPTLASPQVFNHLAYVARVLVPYTAIGTWLEDTNWGEYAEWTGGYGEFSAGDTVPGAIDVGWSNPLRWQWYPSIDDLLNDTNRCNEYGVDFIAPADGVYYGAWINPDEAIG